MTEPAIGPHDASPHAGQVVRRVLLHQNIVIGAETVRLVAAVQAALQAGTPSGKRGPGRCGICRCRSYSKRPYGMGRLTLATVSQLLNGI